MIAEAQALADTTASTFKEEETSQRGSPSDGANTVEPAVGGSPLPEGVSPGLAQDAQMYAEQFGVDLQEALTRLMLQEPIGHLNGDLLDNEADTFAGLWIQHEPDYRVIVVFTQDGQKTLRAYVEGTILEEIVEVRIAEATLKNLEKAQREANRVVAGLDFQVASGINVYENRVELYPADRAELEAALRENGLTLPAFVRIVGQ